MLTSMLQETTAVLDRRFAVTAFLPSTLLVGLLGVVAAVSWLGRRDAADAWNEMDNLSRGLLAVGVILAGMLLATLAVRNATGLIRLYEGYWSSAPGRRLARLGSNHHRQRLAALADSAGSDPAAYRRIHLGYPLPTQPELVMPTTLGNILRNAELHPRDRYGIDAVLVWPRLYALLPDRMASLVAAARADLDSLLVTSALALAFAVAAGGNVLAAHGPAWLFATCTAAGLAVSWAGYRSAIRAAVVYGQHVKVAFDVYRNDLLQQIGLPIPEDGAAELRCWERLGLLWYRNVPGAAEESPLPAPQPASTRGLPLGRTALCLAAALTACGTAYLAMT
ncbi:hypothetical protein K1W54_09380 [Micromonospora sp. CPCC 205371]|nr:hypothetical protein [Micromonospora sp. CPCC 205371]